MKEVSQCLFCGSLRQKLRYRAGDRMFPIGSQYNLQECADCGLLYLNPQPTAAELAAHYPSNYYSFEGDRAEDVRFARWYRAIYGPGSTPLERLRYLPYKIVLRTMIGRRGQRVLDVGCGSGHYLAMAQKILGFDGYGVEPNAYDKEFALTHGLRIFNCTLEEAAFADDFFDAITLNHVFEHISDPLSTLCELRRILKPGGTLVISVPQKKCALYWLFGRQWHQLDVPRHLFVPSRNNLAKVVHSTGFQITHIRYNGRPENFLQTLHYWWCDLRGRPTDLQHWAPPRIAFWACLPLAYLSNYARVGDQIEMFLSKT